MVKIYHAKNPNFGFPSLCCPDPVWPNDFEHVADLAICGPDDNVILEMAFEFTNHVQFAWHKIRKEVVTCFVDNPRSTSVGDIAVIGDKRYCCDFAGWKDMS